MPNFFVVSDTHFSHELMRKLRGFESVEAMDEFMVEKWNNVVKPSDHVYHLGDVALKKQHLHIVKRLNGKKRLVMGNHDIFEAKHYFAAGFQKVMAYRVLDNFILSHIPISAGSLGRFKCNIHGHTHGSLVKDKDGGPHKDYYNACVELNAYSPIPLEEIKAWRAKQDE